MLRLGFVVIAVVAVAACKPKSDKETRCHAVVAHMRDVSRMPMREGDVSMMMGACKMWIDDTIDCLMVAKDDAEIDRCKAQVSDQRLGNGQCRDHVPSTSSSISMCSIASSARVSNLPFHTRARTVSPDRELDPRRRGDDRARTARVLDHLLFHLGSDLLHVIQRRQLGHDAV